jgi:hypothetical protein
MRKKGFGMSYGDNKKTHHDLNYQRHKKKEGGEYIIITGTKPPNTCRLQIS